MNGWNPRNPKQWAQLLGLVAVPLFGALRARATPGCHALMLDGAAGSFALSTSGPKSFISGQQPIVWAWSANVRHAVSIDSGAASATVRRWDAPSAVEQWPVVHEKDVRALVRSFDDLEKPAAGQTVIDRGLLTFRDIRLAIEKQGGSELDTILAFNTVLAWVAQDDKREAVEFAEAIRILRKKDKLLAFSEDQISRRLRTYPLGDLARLLREGNSERTPYLLDADLLIRHASGPLYQEAHKVLAGPPQQDSQRELFPNDMLLVGRERPHAPAPRFVHHTPPSLARALVEIALQHLESIGPDGNVRILDPACGSGVFLIEAVRESSARGMQSPASIRGFDKSELAVAMAEFCVRHASADIIDDESVISIATRDSLNGKSWGSPDVIAMNPPFVAWEHLDDDARKSVERALGPFHQGRPDLAVAFFYRAIESLPVGGVVASILPPSFFESETAEELRSFLMQSSKFQVRLLGHFQDFEYFDAVVEPSFIVVVRSEKESPVRIVTATRGFADQAIRTLRSLPWTKSHVATGYEVYSIPSDELSVERWTPQPQRDVQFTRALKANTFTTVADFFIPRLGARPGNKPVFIVADNELATIAPTKAEKRFFRPLADRIENGQIQPDGFIFYPYADNGALLLKTEAAVKAAVPTFYSERLKPAISALKNRTRYRQWWELTRPVATWLAAKTPRIVSQAYGHAGNFGFDSQGEFAVVQGVGWCWRGDKPADQTTLLAYLALLNSNTFDRALACFCPRVRGGQFNITQHFIERVPLPALSDEHVRESLAQIGLALWKGNAIDTKQHDAMVLLAYGLSADGTPLEIQKNESRRGERRFKDLAKRWQQATGFYSRVDRKIKHPLYREIVAIGPSVIPFLLRDMRDEPGYWSDALAELTGNDPVPNSADTLDDVAAAWVKWGRQHGYDV